MKDVKVIKQEPAFEVVYSDYNGTYVREVSWRELYKAQVGATFEPYITSCCGRDVQDEKATVLYKDDHGALVRFVTIRTSDSPNPEELPGKTEVLYFEF